MSHLSPSSDAEREARIQVLLSRYGDGADGSSPTREQWTGILDRPRGAPLTLINFFKLREVAEYRDGVASTQSEISGGEAMMRYASVSGPTLEAVGGRFLLMGPFAGSVVGETEDWDMVAVGSYPTGDAVFELFDDEAYCAAYAHRRAAVLRQRVVAVTG